MVNKWLAKLFGNTAKIKTQEMIDIVFDLEGKLLPHDYPFAL